MQPNTTGPAENVLGLFQPEAGVLPVSFFPLPVMSHDDKTAADFLAGKSALTQTLFQHFTDEFMAIGMITLHPAKTMIGIANHTHRIAWITQLGRNFVHVVFPFKKPYEDNLCFTKIAQVPGDAKQYNHHFRMYAPEDVNGEVKGFMKLAFNNETV